MARDPLAAVPVASTLARVESRVPAGIVLVVSEPARRGALGRLVERLGLRRSQRFELDALGESYWSSIDGARTLAEIQAALVAKHGLEPAHARRAVLEFTATLMRRGLIGLELPS